MAEKYDAIVIGAGIAGLGVSALLQRGGMKTLCVEKDEGAGGRMQGFDLEGGWRLDIGLHMAELGDASSSDELVKAAGKEVEWAKFSDTVEIYRNGRWQTLPEMIIAVPQDIEAIKNTMKGIALMDDSDIEANDLASWGDWLEDNVTSEVARELFAINGMIMTTVPDTMEMSAGEILYICRENLRRKRNLLTAAYPVGGMLGIIDPLRQSFEEAGGTLALGTEVDSVLFDGNAARGASIKKRSLSPYPGWFYMDDLGMVEAPVVVCTIPLWGLDAVLDMNPETSVLPEWWIKRYEDLKYETTGLIGYTVALGEPVYDKPNFLSALKLDHAGMPFQAFVPTAYDPGVAPEGKSLLQTDCVVEVDQIFDKFEMDRLLDLMWQDIQEMFPGIDEKVDWKFTYKCVGCDGLARKPGQVGAFKPDIVAPGIEGLYFAGDTYRGRGLALNSAALSGRNCAEKILEKYGT
ncbi:MAG: FAD-dependent oxidoreductase [Actinobacteria bacterium]|nr:FAD-dependent oxidoreductase [Actinomycetota bacterium]